MVLFSVRLMQLAREATALGKMQNNGYYAIHGHLRSLLMAPMESLHITTDL